LPLPQGAGATNPTVLAALPYLQHYSTCSTPYRTCSTTVLAAHPTVLAALQYLQHYSTCSTTVLAAHPTGLAALQYLQHTLQYLQHYSTHSDLYSTHSDWFRPRRGIRKGWIHPSMIQLKQRAAPEGDNCVSRSLQLRLLNGCDCACTVPFDNHSSCAALTCLMNAVGPRTPLSARRLTPSKHGLGYACNDSTGTLLVYSIGHLADSCRRIDLYNKLNLATFCVTIMIISQNLL
jgi:hypothetical protein